MLDKARVQNVLPPAIEHAKPELKTAGGHAMSPSFYLTLLLLFVAESPQPVSLFDGKSFAGWEGDTKKTFRIEQGAIVAGSLDEDVPRNEFLCTTREYGDFELKLKFKVLGKGANAGVQIRSRRIPNHYEMIGYQADLGEAWYGSLYDESRRRKMLAEADPKVVREALRPDDWNDYTIRCQGKRIQFWINGRQTVDYSEPDDSIEQRGLIGLQIHGGPPSEAWYKDIVIEELK
jgi:hypothetical protein